MNELKFLEVMGKLDDDLLKEAQVGTEKQYGTKPSISKRSRTICAAAAAAVIALGFAVFGSTHKSSQLINSDSFVHSQIDTHSSFSAEQNTLSSGEASSEKNGKVNDSRKAAETSQTDTQCEKSDSSDLSAESEGDKNASAEENSSQQITSAVNSAASSEKDNSSGTESSSEASLDKSDDSSTDKLPEKEDLTDIPLAQWLEDTDVVWAESDTKGMLSTERIPLGSTQISDELYDLMNGYPKNTVYAIMVDFASCINESELLEWEHNSETIADLERQITETTEYSQESYTYIGSDGIEHTEYLLTPESEAKVSDIERRINEIRYAFRDEKIKEFEAVFHDNGLEIYEDRLSGIREETFCFYTFASREHLETFNCISSEAFIFYPAYHFK